MIFPSRTVQLTAVILAAVGDRSNLGAYVGALSGDVAEIEVGVLGSSNSREAGEESDLREKHLE